MSKSDELRASERARPYRNNNRYHGFSAENKVDREGIIGRQVPLVIVGSCLRAINTKRNKVEGKCEMSECGRDELCDCRNRDSIRLHGDRHRLVDVISVIVGRWMP